MQAYQCKSQQCVRSIYSCLCIQCFDLSNYITLNDLATPTWKCPHCSIEVGPEQLARDLFTEKLLTELPKHATEIEYTKNTSSYSITKVDDVDDGEDSGDEEQPMKIETPPVKPPEKTVDVIDLISDDESEDDEPLAKRMRLQHNNVYPPHTHTLVLY